ncbi:hypothetical protein AB837_00389 [bacterium AB1]|nr:hypothetical protein AB837_00389 [bacterium AB1]
MFHYSLICNCFIIIICLMFHGELEQDKYGIISREKNNSLDYIVLLFFILLMVNLFILNIKKL